MFSTYRSKGTYSVIPKKGGVKGGVKGRKVIMQKPVIQQKPEKLVEEEEVCPKFQCVLDKTAPAYARSTELKTCPKAACPLGYSPEFEVSQIFSKKHGCPKYTCKPPPPPDAICNVTGRTFNTFDNTEFKYDICTHVLVRDLEKDEWEIACK